MSDGPDGAGDFDGHGDFDHHSLADGIGHEAFEGHDYGHGDHDGHFHGFSYGYQDDVVAAILGGFAVSGFSAGHGSSVSGVSGEVGCRGRRVFLPGLAISPKTVQALAWPHGNVSVHNPQCFANPRAKLRALMEKAGLVDVGFSVRDVAPADEVQLKLMDTTPFDERVGNTPMPAGWYPKATGHTRLWKDFYMIGKRWCFIGPRVADPAELEEGVYLAIAGATWYFDQTMDFETRVAISVKCRTKWDPDAAVWKGALPSVEAHRDAAIKVLREFLDWFKCFPVSKLSADARKRVQSIPLPEDKTKHIPPPSSVPREAFKNLRPSGASGADGIDSQSYPG